MQSNALFIVKLLFWVGVLSTLTSLAMDRYAHTLLKRHWKILLFSVVAVLLWRIPLEGDFVHGTEYEDSYVYTVAGRQLAGHFILPPSGAALPFSIDVCSVGSLTACQQAASFPEHLIGYPYVISLACHLFGYRPSIGSVVNIGCAVLSTIAIFLLCMAITDDILATASASLIFAITPAFAIWGLETSAEPCSNAGISFVLWFAIRHISAPSETDRWNKLLTWCAFSVLLLFSMTVKRENFLLVGITPVIVLFTRPSEERLHRLPLHRLWWLAISTLLGVFMSVPIKLVHTTGQEVALLKTFPLSLGQWADLLPMFLSSFFVIQWYGGVVVLVCLGIVIAWRRKGLALFPLLPFMAYILLYAFHIRGYYEMQSGHTDARAALRFSMNLMSLWSILAGMGISFCCRWLCNTHLWNNHQIALKRIGGCCVIVIAGASYYLTQYEREDAATDEYHMRLTPSLVAMQIAGTDETKKAYVVTLEPLIIQMYAEPTKNIVDFEELDDTTLKKIRLTNNTNVLFLDERIHRGSANTERYRHQLAYVNRHQCDALIENSEFSVVRLCDSH